MILPGLGGLLPPNDSSNVYDVTVGSDTLDLGKSSIEEHGYDADGLTAPFGSVSPGTWRGFTIDAIYSNNSGTTYFRVVGDASALSPHMTAAGVDQLLGAGTYDSTDTTFYSTSDIVTDVFTPNGSHVTVIIT